MPRPSQASTDTAQDDRSRSPRPQPRSPDHPPPRALDLQQHDDEDQPISFTLNMTVNANGPIHEVLKHIGMQIIAQAETNRFSASTVDSRLRRQFDLQDSTFIGGHIIKIDSSLWADAIVADSIYVKFP